MTVGMMTRAPLWGQRSWGSKPPFHVPFRRISKTPTATRTGFGESVSGCRLRNIPSSLVWSLQDLMVVNLR